MTVKIAYDGQRFFETTGAGYDPQGEFLEGGSAINPQDNPALAQVLRIGLLCNEASLERTKDGYVVHGDPTEGALIVSAMKAGFNQDEEKERYLTLAMLPFESELGYMATLHEHAGQLVYISQGCRGETSGPLHRLYDW